MKRKTLQEVIKMTEKERFMYYAELFWGDTRFDMKMTPGGGSAYAMRWENGECVEGPAFLKFEDNVKKIESWL